MAGIQSRASTNLNDDSPRARNANTAKGTFINRDESNRQTQQY